MTFTKTDNPNFIINQKTNMVININEKDLFDYKSKVKQELELRSLRENFKSINNDVIEIKSMLTKLLQR